MAAVENLKNILRESDLSPEVVGEILDGYENVTDRSRKEKRIEFFLNVIRRMEELLPAQQCRNLREKCACSQNIYRTGALRKLAKEVEGKPLKEKLHILTEHKKFGSSSLLPNGHINFCSESFDCSCPVFTGTQTDQKIPDSYCYCCAGYFRNMYQTILGMELRTIEVKSSALVSSGKHKCNIIYEIVAN